MHDANTWRCDRSVLNMHLPQSCHFRALCELGLCTISCLSDTERCKGHPFPTQDREGSLPSCCIYQPVFFQYNAIRRDLGETGKVVEKSEKRIQNWLCMTIELIYDVTIHPKRVKELSIAIDRADVKNIELLRIKFFSEESNENNIQGYNGQKQTKKNFNFTYFDWSNGDRDDNHGLNS